MKKEEYYKAAYEFLQSNKKNKGVRSDLTPGTKKVEDRDRNECVCNAIYAKFKAIWT